MPNGAKPKTIKPTWILLLILIIVLATFIICIILCVADAIGYKINNIGWYYNALGLELSFFFGLITGGNLDLRNKESNKHAG